jgi:hypothetical protein
MLKVPAGTFGIAKIPERLAGATLPYAVRGRNQERPKLLVCGNDSRVARESHVLDDAAEVEIVPIVL